MKYEDPSACTIYVSIIYVCNVHYYIDLEHLLTFFCRYCILIPCECFDLCLCLTDFITSG